MTISLIMRVYESTRENRYCETSILQILLSQFDSGVTSKIYLVINLRYCKNINLFLGSSVGRAVDC